MAKLTYQQMFDKSYLGVIRQGGPSSGWNCCKYRNEDGRKCGIGHLIADERYTSDIEDLGVEGLPLKDLGLPSSAAAISFMTALQQAHDRSSRAADVDHDFMPIYKEAMRAVADAYRLTIPKE